jgi:segregation and condensation protein A
MVVVRELELDLDAFEGPFDLLLTLLLTEELEPADVDMAAIVVAFVQRLSRPWPASAPTGQSPAPPMPDAAGGAPDGGPFFNTVPPSYAPPAAPQERERVEWDLEACGEFLVLIAALLELKARALFPDEEAELAELEPEEAAEELARRLAEYRRMKEAATWLAERLAGERDRFFRVGPAPLAPQPERKLAAQDPEQLAATLRLLAEPPAQVSLVHMALRFPPVSQFLERFRAVLRRCSRFDFDAEVGSLSRVDQAVAFLALLELRKTGEISLEQAAPFSPIRVSRPNDERGSEWIARSA